MSISRQILAFAAAGALTAATAVPAMALENEFHGMFRVRSILSNFDNSSAGSAAIGAEPGSTNGGKTSPTSFYIEQRARLMYIAKANEDLKLVTQFEIDSRFGDNSYGSNGTTRNAGGGIGADQTNLETKNVYLDFKIPSTSIGVKAGIQGFMDNYKGIIFSNDAAGVVASGKCPNTTWQAGYFRFDDAISNATGAVANTNSYLNMGVVPDATTTSLTNLDVGRNTRDFATVGGKYNITKDLVVGADYYLVYSDVLRATQDASYVNMFGVNAEGKLGPATVNGFAIYQTGQLATPTLVAGQGRHQGVNAFAANVAGKMPLGPGTAHATFLYLSGDSNTGTNGGDRNDFQTIMERNGSTSGHTFFESNSMILLRNVYSTDKTDLAVVYDLNNSGRGLITGWAGYDLPLGKAFFNTNVGVAAVAKNNSAVSLNGRAQGSSDVLGTEINAELGYKLYDNLTASLSAAYLVLGDFYSNATANGLPDNP